MKDRFRVRFSVKGWEIQHSRIGIIWSPCGDGVYREKEDAEGYAEALCAGHAPPDWYAKKDKD